MFAFDVRVSPLLIPSLGLAYAIVLGLFLNSGLVVALKIAVVFFLLGAYSIEWWRVLSPMSSRIRRVIVTDYQALLIPRNKCLPPRIMRPPSVSHLSEYLILLHFDAVDAGSSSAVLRLWPGSLSRSDASRLRFYLRFCAGD